MGGTRDEWMTHRGVRVSMSVDENLGICLQVRTWTCRLKGLTGAVNEWDSMGETRDGEKVKQTSAGSDQH